MLRGFFVTGTDTGVGKTVASAALLHYLPCTLRVRHAAPLDGAVPVRYWKPVQTGTATDDDTAVVKHLAGCSAGEVLDAGVRFRRPLSPHLAARLERRRIDVRAILAPVRPLAGQSRWIVEGAGGVLVPLNGSTLMIDLMARLKLPIVIVARSGLGTINHTLLTLEALRHRRLPVAGVILAGAPNEPNRHAIERYGRVPVVGELPIFRPLTPARVQRWATTRLDRKRILEAALT